MGRICWQASRGSIRRGRAGDAMTESPPLAAAWWHAAFQGVLFTLKRILFLSPSGLPYEGWPELSIETHTTEDGGYKLPTPLGEQVSPDDNLDVALLIPLPIHIHRGHHVGIAPDLTNSLRWSLGYDGVHLPLGNGKPASEPSGAGHSRSQRPPLLGQGLVGHAIV